MVMTSIKGQARRDEDVDGGDLGEAPYSAVEGPYPTVYSSERSPFPSSLDSYQRRGLSPKGLSKSPSVPAGAVPGMMQVPME